MGSYLVNSTVLFSQTKKKYFCETIDLNIIFRRSHPFNISKGNFVGNMLLLCSDGYLTQKEFWCIPDAVIQSCSRKRFSTNLAIHIEKHQRWPPFLPFFQSSYPTEQLSQEKISYSKSTIKTLEKNIKCLKFTKKIPEQRHCRSSSVFTVNFEHTSHLFLVFLLLAIIVA